MKKITLFIVFLSFLYTSSAQKVYFIYFQSEADQQFFVKLGDKFHSSSASGYLILSKLRDSVYDVAVGFPQKKWPEQNFSVPVNSKDHGFLLKNFGEKGWGLFDLQTLAVQMSSAKMPQKEISANKKDVSDFADMLSKASDDPSLKEKQTTVKQIEDKKEFDAKEQVPQELQDKKEMNAIETPVLKSEEAVIKKDVVAEKPEPVNTLARDRDANLPSDEKVGKDNPAKEQLVNQKKQDSYQKSVISKKSESSTTGGFGLVFTDEYSDGTSDTVSIFIPNSNLFPKGKSVEAKDEKKFLDINTEIPVKKEHEKTRGAIKISEQGNKTANTISDKCAAVANESDFFQLRKKMAAAETNEEMMNQAKAFFDLKCFTTEQIKNLSTLFLKDEEKYRFLDIAYSHVSDAENYKNLETELKDDYYITRFKAMLRN